MEAGKLQDATRRTRLANERTYLAWWRTGLTALAVSFGAGKLLPELSGGANWPFELVGAAFALIGVVFMVYGYVRHNEVDRALTEASMRASRPVRRYSSPSREGYSGSRRCSSSRCARREPLTHAASTVARCESPRPCSPRH